MPFPFTLPTTSAVSFIDFFESSSHPSLPLTATTYRSVLRDVLKKYKRLPAASQSSHIPVVQDALNSYLPSLLTLFHTLQGQPIAGEHVQLSQTKEFEAEWRCTLTSSIPGREPSRVKVIGISSEVGFVLQTLAYTHIIAARRQLLGIYNASSPSPEQRTNAITSAMKQMLEAQSIHAYVSTLPSSHPVPVDISQAMSSALSSLALAEATMIVVSKDDPYAAAVAEDRDQNSKEWMIAAPLIPKVRAHLFARLCIAAADHAAKASGLLARAGNVDGTLLRYSDDLRKTSRGKAARLLGIDAEVSARTGEGIAWLRGAKRELGIPVGVEPGRKGFKGLQLGWSERREDRRVKKGDEDWGMDAGRLEETRVVEWLENKWVKSNDTINVQQVPPFDTLLATMPSGREYHAPKQYMPQALDAGALSAMRAPPDQRQSAFQGTDNDSSGEDTPSRPADPVGAFPGTASYY